MRTHRLILLVILTVLAFSLIAGCGSAGTQQASEQSSQEAHEAVQDAESQNDEASQDASGRPFKVSLGFAGDLCLADNYIPMQHLAELGSTNIADGIDQRFIDKMREMDLMWINNEFAFSDRGEPIGDKMWTFCGSPANVTYLHDLGVDIVGLANNHVFDFGEDAFYDTLDTLSNAGIPQVGAGRNIAEASAPVYLQAKDLKIAYVAASRAEYTVYTPEATEDSPGIMWCYDDEKFLAEIREAAANADYVVALPHWGVEHSTDLEPEQVQSAHDYIDAGADAVIGAHPHILQGIEFYEGKPIMYSLGNFWFDDYDIDTLVAEIRMTGTRDANGRVELDGAQIELVLHPGTQSGVFTAWAPNDDERSRIFRHLEDISYGQVTISEDGVVSAAG